MGIVAKAIDDFAAPGLLFHASATVDAAGAEGQKWLREVFLHVLPAIHVAIKGQSRSGTRSYPGTR